MVTKHPTILPPLMLKIVQAADDESTQEAMTNKIEFPSQDPVFMPRPSPSQQVGQRASDFSQFKRNSSYCEWKTFCFNVQSTENIGEGEE
ncbi:hypothetical protein OROHE_015971 [Orobanche hederae]